MIANKRVSISIAIFIIAIFMFSVVPAQTAHAADSTASACDSPVKTLTVTAAPSGKDSDVSYDSLSLTADMGTCVTIKFVNKAPSQEHSFTIDKTASFAGVDIGLMNATDGTDGGNSLSTNVMLPSSPADLEYFCDVPGHKAAGMDGTLHVVDPNAKGGFLPGFTMPLTIVSLLSIMVVGSIIRQKKMKAINY